MGKQNQLNTILNVPPRYTVYLKHPNKTLTAQGLGDADNNWILQNPDNAIIVPKDNVAYIVENVDQVTRNQIMQQQLEQQVQSQIEQQQEIQHEESSEPGSNVELGFETGLNLNVQRGNE